MRNPSVFGSLCQCHTFTLGEGGVFVNPTIALSFAAQSTIMWPVILISAILFASWSASKNMNILFIAQNSPLESIGGVERYIVNLINYCKDVPSQKIVIMMPTSGESRTEHHGSVIIYHEKSLYRYGLDNQKAISKRAHKFVVVVAEVIDKHKIDIICAENFHVGLPAAYCILLTMVAGLHKIPLVARLHSFAVTDLQIELINQLMWEKISCVSKSVAGDCFQKGADIDLLSTNYLGINPKEFYQEKYNTGQLKKELHLLPETKLILTATRIIHGTRNVLQKKGVINLLEAFSKIAPRYPYLKLLIAVGKPPESLNKEYTQAFDMLTGYIKLHNIEDRVLLRNFRLEQMCKVYNGADLFVLPSENETFGQVFIESMACGLPVIGTNVGGIPEIISDSYNGYLVPPNDASLLAQKMERIINDESLSKRFIRNGLKTVADTFTCQKQFEIFFDMLQEVVFKNSNTRQISIKDTLSNIKTQVLSPSL